MNMCDKVQNNVDELVKNTLDPKQEAEYRSHIEGCQQCQAEYQRHQEYLALLSSVDDEEVLSDTEVDVMVKSAIRKASLPSIDWSFWKGFAAASLFAIGLLGLLTFNGIEPSQTNRFVSNQVLDTEVTLVIDAPTDIYNAEFTIELPERMALQGYDEFDELNWVLDFTQGKNAIRLPLQIAAGIDLSKPLMIKAVLDSGDSQKTFELFIDLNADTESV